jgi:heptosyltransferase-2
VSDPARVLVRLPNWLGDSLLARPMLFALRRGFPNAHVAAIGPSAVLALLEPDASWNEARPLEPGAPAPAIPPAPDPAMPGARADLAVLCPPSFSSAWRAWRAGCRRRIGFRGDARDWLLTDPVRRPPRGNLHLSEEYLLLAERVGAPRAGFAPLSAAPLPAERRQELVGHSGEGGYALLAPGAIYGPAKRWAPDKFIAVGRALAARGLAVIACGGGGEREVCEVVARTVPGARSLAGRTRLDELAALCAAARLVIANDSGLAHLAAAVGAPTVVVFGSTSSAWTAPLGEHVRVVQRPPVCSPCFQRECSIGYRCLEAVTVGAVLGAAETLAA